MLKKTPNNLNNLNNSKTSGIPDDTPRSSSSKKPTISAKEQELISLLQQTRADFENFRKRTDEQKSLAEKLAAEKTVLKFIPLLDVIKIAIDSNSDLKPLEKTLEKTLSELNLEIIAPAKDALFDPNLHEALSMEDTSGDTEAISALLRPGYIYRDNVIRPALVNVKNI